MSMQAKGESADNGAMANLAAEVERLKEENERQRRELDTQRRELRRLRRVARAAGDGGGQGGKTDSDEPDSPTILERLPQDIRSRVLDFSGGEAWHRGVRSTNKALRLLCATKEMRDAVRRWAMGEFKRGMDFYYATNGSVEDEEAGKALVMRAAAAGLRPARAECFFWGLGTSEDDDKAAALFQAELDDSGSKTEASGGACSWSACRLAYCYCFDHGVEEDYAWALELYTHAAETDENGYAMYRLYKVYRYGQLGQAEDHARATTWIRRSADSGYYFACFELGGILEHGILGVDVNLKEALRCYKKAEEQSPGSCTYEIARVSAAIAAQSDSNNDAEA